MCWHDDITFFYTNKFDDILKFVKEERENGKNVLPKDDEILNAFNYTPLEKVKVVILGQDPYPTPGHAHGLAFSVKSDVRPIPGSLRNIFQELRTDLGGRPNHGCLTSWAEQGVLLLNTSLTVEAKNPGSHKDIGWNELTAEAINLVSNKKDNVVFVLWGSHAQSQRCFIERQDKHLIIEGVHPSPLSAHRGFLKSKPFSKINKYLQDTGQDTVQWF